MYNKRTQLNINITPENLDCLKSIAIKSGKTLGSLVNDILSEFIENQKILGDNLKIFEKRIDLLENKIELIYNKLSDEKKSLPTFNEELANRYTHLIRQDFRNAKRELMLTGKELIDKLIQTEIGKKMDKKYVDILRDVMNEDYSFTAKHMQFMIERYGTLPCFSAIYEIKPSPKLKDFCREVGILK
tara:strand:+ start:83 stop:643 length:561 start_codon:yes stop_codon:yes gene_type:complete